MYYHAWKPKTGFRVGAKTKFIYSKTKRNVIVENKNKPEFPENPL